MTALTKNTFTFPNFGSMLHALNNGSAKKAGTAQSTDGVLVPCQWDSLSDVRRHRPSKYVHQIRMVESTGDLELRMMHRAQSCTAFESSAIRRAECAWCASVPVVEQMQTSRFPSRKPWKAKWPNNSYPRLLEAGWVHSCQSRRWHVSNL